MFNTLMYAKKLEESGVSREQAETHVQIFAEIIEGSLVTKQDFKDLEHKMELLSQEIRSEMIQLEYRLMIKLGTITCLAIGTATAVLSFVIKSH
jgi:hypothetical protein